MDEAGVLRELVSQFGTAGLSAPGLLVVLYCAVVAWNWRQVR